MPYDRTMKDAPNEYWRQKLTAAQYHILRDKGTEPPFTGKLIDNHENGGYHCAACGQLLFNSDAKFDSGTGWPSFTDPVNREHVELHNDTRYNMQRVEVTCAHCGGHLGHVFDDGPADKGGKRYCVNSCALDFRPQTEGAKQ